MENNNYPAWKHALLYGLYTGIALIITTLLFYVLDLYAEKWVGYFGYAILLGGIIMGTLSYRNKYLGGFITYGQSVSTGFLTGLFAAILSSIFTFIFVSVIGDDYLQTIMETAEESMISRDPDMSDEELDLAMKMTERMMNPTWISILAFLGYTVLSLVFALIASIFIKKDVSVDDETE